MTVTNFLNFTPHSINSGYPRVTAAFSILGTNKEDSLLSYARDNHITYLELYDLYRVFRYNDSAGTVLPNGLSLIEGLCNFMEKARNEYCITEIGAGGETQDFFTLADTVNQSNLWLSPPISLDSTEQQLLGQNSSLLNLLTNSYNTSDSLFRISEQLKNMVRMFRFNGGCTSHFDFYNVIDEQMWTCECTNHYTNHFVPLMHYVDTLKTLYNLSHSDSVRIAVYIRAISTNSHPTLNSRDSMAAYLVDGYDTIAALADRILAVHYGYSGANQYNNAAWKSQVELFKRPLSRNKTDYHPYFSTETAFMTNYVDFLGPWLRDKYNHNIFQAEDEFYRRWRAEPTTNINNVNENDITPGGFHYFASAFMIDSLKSPRIDSTNSPICTSGSLGDSLRVYYMGPREEGITLTFQINNNGNLITLNDTTGPATALLDNVSFPAVFLDTLHNPYSVQLTLNYGNGCTYTYHDTVYVHSRPFVQALSSTSFCEGGNVTLKASRGTSYIWRRNGVQILSSNSQFYVANLSGTYVCEISGPGCVGASNQIVVNVLSSPAISIFTNCLDINRTVLSVIPTAPVGSVYSWSTGSTNATDTTTTPGGYNYYVTVTYPSGCSQNANKGFSLPNHIPNPHITSTNSVYCKNNPLVPTVELNPNDFVYGSMYFWTVNGQTTPTYGTFTLPAPDVNTTVTLQQISATGCSNVGHDTIQLSVFNCCNNPEFTAFLSDSSSNYPSGWNSQSINISGDFYINSNSTITGSTLDIDSSARIYVQSGKTLTVSNSTLESCTSMWQGIMLANSSSSLIVQGGSIIRDAVIGIDAINDARVEIHGSSLVNNGMGIFLHDGTFSNFIANGATFSGASGLYPNYGIRLENTANVSIGDGGYVMNNFSNFYAGIFSLTSNLTVRNCTFSNNLKPCSPQSFSCYNGQGSGILAQGDPRSIYSLNVGGSSAEACFFNDNTYGIFMKTNIELNATHNSFNNIGYMNQNISYGIYGVNAVNAKQNVSGNLLNRLNYGVWFSNIHDAEININENKFNDFLSVPARQGERAITVWSTNPFGNAYTRSIRLNIIEHFKQGISLTHQQGIAVEDNRIHFDRLNPNSVWYGIRVLGGLENVIRLNSMNRTGTQPDLPLSRLVYGTSIERSEKNSILENDIYNLGSGIRFFATTVTNSVKCNNLIYNVDNLVTENALIGDQGSPNSAADNFWDINQFTALTSSDHGNILNIGSNPNPAPNFYVQDLPGYNPDFNGVGDCPYVCPPNAARIEIGADPSQGCSNTGCTNPFCYQDMIAQIIDEQAQFANLPDEQGEDARKYAFELLLRDSMLMYQGTLLDAKLRDFYIEMKEGNAGMFKEIVNLLQQEDNSGAIIVNSTITPENLSESNMQLFIEICLATWAENNFELDAYQISILEFIAYQNPYSGGDAVYSARVMLGLDIADFITIPAERKRQETDESTLLDQGIIVPNPNTGKMSYIYTMAYEDNSEFQIFNSRGGLIRSYKLVFESKSLDIDLSDQTNGIYVYRVVTNGKIYAGNKIILQK